MVCVLAVASIGCGVISFTDQPALGYAYGSQAPLRIAVVDATGDDSWAPAITSAVATYAAASPYLIFQADAGRANIVITIRAYRDSNPPQLRGYLFPINAGGFAAVYDPDGAACNYPPSTLPLNCTGTIAAADIYLNELIPSGPDIETRRERLILHEMGHAMGLTRHSPDLDIAQLATRYGWQPAP